MTALKWWKPEMLIPSSRDVLDAQRLVEVFAEPRDGLGNAVGGAPQDREVPEPAALRANQEPTAKATCPAIMGIAPPVCREFPFADSE